MTDAALPVWVSLAGPKLGSIGVGLMLGVVGGVSSAKGKTVTGPVESIIAKVKNEVLNFKLKVKN